MDTEQIVTKIVEEIKKFFRDNNVTKAIVGISGGVDSAVAAKLCIMALGKENVIGVLMPELGVSSLLNIEHANGFCVKEDIKSIYQPINSALKGYDFVEEINTSAQLNLKARVRANILYSYANTYNALVIGTGNKSEAMMGYATKYGDLACDIFVISDLLKKEVYAVAKQIEIDEHFITKIPTAELFDGQTDEKELGLSYEELDEQLESGEHSEEVAKRIKEHEHKRKFPYCVKVR